MMLKSVLEFYILKSYVPLQSCSYPMQENLPKMAELGWQVKIRLAPSEIPANLPIQFSLSGQIFLHWEAATLKGHVGFQNKNF